MLMIELALDAEECDFCCGKGETLLRLINETSAAIEPKRTLVATFCAFCLRDVVTEAAPLIAESVRNGVALFRLSEAMPLV